MDNIKRTSDSHYTPQELLEELISRYRNYYDLSYNEAIKEIRHDAQTKKIQTIRINRWIEGK
tara:strand:- start:180 stop:365 length:186 start_codon:yes stop_codon:yes gene_type:complete